MIHTSEMIVLHSTKVGERNLVIHTLSREWGRRSFITSLGKASGAGLFQPLSILEGEISENSLSDLWRIRNMKASTPLHGIRSNIHKNTMTLFMSEVLLRAVHDSQKEDGLYDWCKRSILTLDSLEDNFSNCHLVFLAELCSIMGFSPSAEGMAPFAGKQFANISILLESSPAARMLLPLSGEDRSDIAEAFLKYLSCHTQTTIEARSLKVLRELYR